jgi:addiction module HigA family antidote
MAKTTKPQTFTAPSRLALERPPTHPGEVLREDILPAVGLSVQAAARAMGVTRQALHRVTSCSAAVSPEMALRIGSLTGTPPELLLSLQQTYDLWHTASALRESLRKISESRPARVAIDPPLAKGRSATVTYDAGYPGRRRTRKHVA